MNVYGTEWVQQASRHEGGAYQRDGGCSESRAARPARHRLPVTQQSSHCAPPVRHYNKQQAAVHDVNNVCACALNSLKDTF